MKRKILFPILLFIFPFIVSSQSTAKEWYSKGIELKGKQDYEGALAAFKMLFQKKLIIMKPITRLVGVVMN